ncbi:beta-L-arabinofuranosidase domain-containing protein [Paenibacillus sp. HWE-109]|uniref:beta-L-arabinofuranosidase domain-containing protein n=1 Tax=Paenibacillus sp. HWE-109 TaxID=1306526 RepID=UPI003FCC6BE3
MIVLKAHTNPTTLRHFGLNQIQLSDDILTHAFKKEWTYLTSYEADRLLAGFRETKGLQPKADKYSGWENTEIRGHTLGHYLIAISQAYSQTKDKDMLARIEYLVAELAQCQQDSGYLSAFPETLFDNVENRKPAWVPWYTLHKIIAGLIAVYHATKLQQAFHVVNHLGDWVANRALAWTDEVQTTVLAVEYGGMNDCLYDLYKLTGNNRHLEAAHRFDEVSLFDALRERRDVLKGKHANTMIPKFIGALNRYLTLGESEHSYFEAAVNFWDTVVYHHSYITGGNSECEHFGEPDELDSKRSDVTCETCNSYNMLKLTKELFKLTQDIKYADFYERTYLNAILSSQNPDTGMTMYFQPMATGYFKIYSSPFEHFWCCTGTGMESFTKLNDSIYFYADNQLYVNQFVSSKLLWQEQHVTITQSTSLPQTDRVHLTVETMEPKQLALHIRIPYWAAEAIEMTVNGERVSPIVERGYAIINRIWQDGDTIGLRIPMKVAYSRLPDSPHVIGLQYGPVVLSAALGTEDMVESKTGILVSVATRRMILKDYIVPQGMCVEEWLGRFDEHVIRLGEDLAFALKHTDEDERLVFTPHYKQHRERYGIYWSLLDVGSEELKKHVEKAERERNLREATLDAIQIGNDQYELEHQVQGERTYGGTWEGLNGRMVEAGGWFSYQMKVQPGAALAVTFNQLHTNRSCDIFIDGELLATEMFTKEWKRIFYERIFVLPDSLTAGKEVVTIKFMPREMENGIYGVLRILKHMT